MLERDLWPTLVKRAKEVGQCLNEADGNLWGRGGLPALILEDAYRWAAEFPDEQARTTQAHALAREVEELDQRILKLAGLLSEALQRRTEVREQHGIGTDWTAPGLGFEDLIEATVCRFPAYRSRVQSPLDLFLRAGRQTSATSPELQDLLDALSASARGELWATQGADRESIRLGAGSAEAGMAAKLRRFFGSVDDHSMMDRFSVHLHPLDWMTSKGIASLLSVALGWDPVSSPIQPEQVKKLRVRWMREQR